MHQYLEKNTDKFITNYVCKNKTLLRHAQDAETGALISKEEHALLMALTKSGRSQQNFNFILVNYYSEGKCNFMYMQLMYMQLM